MLQANPPISSTARRLIAARALRSVGQGALVVDFALYLHALHWSPVAIGSVFMGGLVFGGVLTLLLGPLSDRLGRRHFLLGYELSQMAAALVALFSQQPALIALAAVIGGFGRGANGSPGPFAPVEQSWLAGEIVPALRGSVFSLNTALGFFGMALGALGAMIPGLIHSGHPPAEDYRVLFVIVLLGSFACFALLYGAADPLRRDAAPAGAEPDTGRADRRLRENGLLLRLVGVNAINGLGIGLIGPLMAYWFELRFGVGPAAIAPMMSLAFVVTGLASLIAGRLSRHIGVVDAVVWPRLVGLLLLIPMALAPSFFWAGFFYVLRSGLNRGTVGARQALGVSLVGDDRRGLAASLNTVSMMLPLAVGPVVAGAFFQAGMLLPPFLLAAGLQGVYLYLYHRLFRAHDPGRRAAG
ncbi:MFS transporter [Acidihalobacter aeolianus]|uniref:MFS transporter n=1 Tax=Acidihalobacter aeolianus TaxID=2792603 RepID=UPI000A608B6B|nr:MFS transporter [Acidihalobacter aeolianus]